MLERNQTWREPARRDFSEVLAALEDYTRASGRQAMNISGWDVEDASIGPPATLATRLASISPRLGGYTYARDLHTVKRHAATLFAGDTSLGGEPPTAAHVAVVQNSTQALLLALAALKGRGIEHAVVASPAYFAAVEACAHLGLPITFISTADFFTGALDVERIASTAAGRRSIVLLTNPAYSLGIEYTAADLNELFAAMPAGCWVLLDETRLGLSWRYDAPWYPVAFPDHVVLLRSPSKVFFVNGLKTSVILAPPSLVREVDRLGEALLGSLPGHAGEVAVSYLDAWSRWRDEALAGSPGPMLRWKRHIVARLRANLQTVVAPLRAAGYTLSPVDSGPYVLAGASLVGRSALDSLALASRSGVLLMDSAYFYHESDDWTAFRINLCANPDLLRAALAHVVDAVKVAPAAG